MGALTRRLALSSVLVVALTGAACGGASVSGPVAGSPSPTQGATPMASPSALPTTAHVPPHDYGPPPAGVDLLYVQAPGAPTWLIGYDWQGQPRATVHLTELDDASNSPTGITVAPNGAGFTGGFYTFDRLGHVIYQYQPSGKGFAVNTWSADGGLLCGVEEQSSQMDSNGNGTTDFYFVRRAPTGPPVRVARFLHLNAIPGDMSYKAYTCSNELDRALVVRTVCCGVQGAIAIRISDGAILGTWERDAGSPTFSPDGQLVADPTWNNAGATLSTVVSTVLGGTVLARYGPGIAFRAFSNNNRQAIVMSERAGGSVAEVIEVATRRLVWQDSASRSISGVWSRPGSGDIAIAFTASPAQIPCPNASSQPCTNPESQVVIIHPDGSSVRLSGTFLLPMPSWEPPL
jgi:hypothetical protein